MLRPLDRGALHPSETLTRMDYLGIRFSLGLDPLSGFFLGVIFLITLPAMVYAVGYLK